MSMKKTIVISAVNLRKGGTLTILRSCLSYLSDVAVSKNFRVVALVHQRSLADYPHIEYIELPHAVESWAKRLWCEYVEMHRISKQIGDIDLWLSLHDTTPRVIARRQAVYCQTSFPFYRWKWSDLRFDYKIPLFAMLTQYAYRINIRRNRYLIVQQEWLRKGFSEMFHLPEERFLVSPPLRADVEQVEPSASAGQPYTFLYAATPDCHKNFETLCEAARLLEEKKHSFRVVLTIKGDENKYAQWLHTQYAAVKSIDFAGYMSRETLFQCYADSQCLVFPSQIETWGLPISEFMAYNKPMLLADLPYAHETSAGSTQTAFFSPRDAKELAEEMETLLARNTAFLQNIPENPQKNTHLIGWDRLFTVLLQ